jgi:hypothetical protein
MSIPTDIPLCPRAHDAIRRCLEAAERDAGTDLSLALGERASDQPLCCCIQAALRGRPGWSFDPAAEWDARIDLASVLTDQALRRAYAAQAIREAQVPAILGKDLSWGLVYYRIGNRQYARLYVIPADPLTPAQQRMRAIMRAVSQAAKALLTPKQKRAWIAAAAKVQSRLRLECGPLTWQMLFVKLNTVLALLGRELLLWPPDPVCFGPNPVAALVPSYENGQFRLAVKVSGPEVEDIMVFGEAPVGPKRKKLRHPVFLGLLPASAEGLSDITAQYVGRFGEPAPGQKVLIGVQQQVNGWKGPMQVLGEVVPARPVEAPRNTRNTRNGLEAGAGLKGLRELLGLHELHELNELNQLLGLPGLRELPRFPLSAPGRAPGHKPGTTAAPRQHPGSTPLCITRCFDLSEARIQPRHDPLPGFGFRISGFGFHPSGWGVAKTRRKCHRRDLWRGT